MINININIDDNLINKIVIELEETGFFCLDNVIDMDFINLLKKEVLNIATAKNKNYFSIIDICSDQSLIFNNFIKNHKFIYLLENVRNGIIKKNIKNESVGISHLDHYLVLMQLSCRNYQQISHSNVPK